MLELLQSKKKKKVFWDFISRLVKIRNMYNSILK